MKETSPSLAVRGDSKKTSFTHLWSARARSRSAPSDAARCTSDTGTHCKPPPTATPPGRVVKRLSRLQTTFKSLSKEDRNKTKNERGRHSPTTLALGRCNLEPRLKAPCFQPLKVGVRTSLSTRTRLSSLRTTLALCSFADCENPPPSVLMISPRPSLGLALPAEADVGILVEHVTERVAHRVVLILQDVGGCRVVFETNGFERDVLSRS